MAFRNSAFAVAALGLFVLTQLAVGLMPDGGPGARGALDWQVTAETPVGMPTNHVQVYMMENFELSAERPEAAETPIKVQVPDGYVGDRLFGMLGHVEDRYVGTWNSGKIRFNILTAGTMTFRLWLYDDRSRTGTFNLTLYKNEDPLNLVATATFRSVSIDDPPEFHQLTVPLTMNNTEFKPGDQLSLRIDAAVNGGCFIMYGTPQYDTGMVVTADSLRVEKLEAGTSGFEIWYKDAFNVRPTSMVYWCEVDNKPLTRNELIQKEVSMEGLFNIVRWNFPLDGGMVHEFTVAVHYGGELSTNITYGPVEKEVGSMEQKSMLPGFVTCGIVSFILLIVAVIGITQFLKYRRRKMLERVRMHRWRKQLIAAGELPAGATMADVRRYLIRTGHIEDPRNRGRVRRREEDYREEEEEEVEEEIPEAVSRPAADEDPSIRQGRTVYGEDVPDAVVLEPVEG